MNQFILSVIRPKYAPIFALFLLASLLLIFPKLALAGSAKLCVGESPLIGAAPGFVIVGTTLCEGSASGKSVKVEVNDTGAGGGWNSLKADQNLEAGNNVIVGKAVTFVNGAGLASGTGSNAAVTLSGTAANTSHTGVLITGSGLNGIVYNPTSGSAPTWADVSIQSQNYDDNDPKKGSAIKITDYGVQIITPETVSGQKLSNASFMNSGSGNMSNSFGGNTSTAAGATTNNFGVNNSPDPNSSMVNNMGGGAGASANYIGAGTGASTNGMGNTASGTTNTFTASNSNITMQTGAIVSTVGVSDLNDPQNSGTGETILPNGTDQTSIATTSLLKGAHGITTKIDSKGKITLTQTGSAEQTTAAMTVTNGLGNTHGFIVTEEQASISGGTRSSTMTVNDFGATFSNSLTGAPIQVHGVADGTAQFDAVNVRQLYGAVAASMATVPNFTVERGESGIGFGTAMMGSYPAIGMAYATKGKDGSQINIGVAAAQNVPLAVRAGVGWVW